jgi:hypothetical protein
MPSVRRRSGAWYARWVDADGVHHERRAGTDKRSAEQLAAALEAEATLVRSGVVDFHALRGASISNLVSAGASVKTCQTLARHSTPDLTIGVYAKASLHGNSGVVEGLPDLTTPRHARESPRDRDGWAYQQAACPHLAHWRGWKRSVSVGFCRDGVPGCSHVERGESP